MASGDDATKPQEPPFWETPDGGALSRVLKLGLTAGGIGAGARALIGARDLFNQQLQRRRDPRRPAVIEMNVPEISGEEEEVPDRRYQRGFGKVAGEEDPWYQRLNPLNLFRSNQPAGPPRPSFMSRKVHGSDIATPWFMPAAGAAAVGGLYGGYKLLDGALDWVHRRDRKKEVEDAKDEYRRSLIEQYSADSPAIKRSAATDELTQDLNTLYDLYSEEMTKQALPSLNDMAGMGTGAYLTLAGLLAGGSGIAAYNWAKGNSPEERVSKAIKQRERLRWATRPPEIYAVAKSHPARFGEVDAGQPEEEESIRKVAALYR